MIKTNVVEMNEVFTFLSSINIDATILQEDSDFCYVMNENVCSLRTKKEYIEHSDNYSIKFNSFIFNFFEYLNVEEFLLVNHISETIL